MEKNQSQINYDYQFLSNSQKQTKEELLKELKNWQHKESLLRKIDNAYIDLLNKDMTKYERKDYGRDFIIKIVLNKWNKVVQDYIAQGTIWDIQILMQSLRASGTKADKILWELYNHLDSTIKIKKLANIITIDQKENYYENNIIWVFADILKASGINEGSINNLLECNEEDIINLLKLIDDPKIYEYNRKPHEISKLIGRYFDPINTSNTLDQAKKVINILLKLDYNDQILIYSWMEISSLMNNGSLGDMMLYLEENQSITIIKELIKELREIEISDLWIYYIIYDIFNNRIPSNYFDINRAKTEAIIFDIKNIAPYSIKTEKIGSIKIQTILDRILQKLIIGYSKGSYEWI